MSRWMHVRVERQKRDVAVYLSMGGYSDFAEAKSGLITHLRENGVTEDGGTVERVDDLDNQIAVETDLCGFGITDDDIKTAMAIQGAEHSC